MLAGGIIAVETRCYRDILNLAAHTLADSTLKHLGITGMNFSARRFSTC